MTNRTKGRIVLASVVAVVVVMCVVWQLQRGGEPRMVEIAPGTFLKGSPTTEVDRGNDETAHMVSITESFLIGNQEVTQKEYLEVMGTNPSHFQGNTKPVENVTWDDAMAFCQKLMKKHHRSSRLAKDWTYKLPTEAQWEYACRAGSTTAFCYGDDPNKLTKVAWHARTGAISVDASPDTDLAAEKLVWTSPGSGPAPETHPIGKKHPNAWGLYDMHGNVDEWCLDSYFSDPTQSPAGSQSPFRVIKGGSLGGRPRKLPLGVSIPLPTR